MRIPLCLAFAVAALLPAPGSAGVVTASSSKSGTVTTAVLSPVPQKALFNAGAGQNGLFGYVIQVPDGANYTLTRPSNVLGHLDAYFFQAGPSGTIGDSCGSQSQDDETVFEQPEFVAQQVFDATETGVACPGTDVGKYAIIVARTGANIPFTFSY